MLAPLNFVRTNLLGCVASAAALVLLGLSPALAASEAAAPGSPAPSATVPAAPAPPTRAQLDLLHQMDPALHFGRAHHHGPHAGPGAHECPCQTPPSSQGGPRPEAPEAQSATVNGTLTINSAGASRTLSLSDLQHDKAAPCFWPVGGSIQLTGADNVAHTAIFAPECGHVTLDDANIVLPTKHDFEHGHGHGSLRRKMGRQAPLAPPPSP